jgi:hypothetical protein
MITMNEKANVIRELNEVARAVFNHKNDTPQVLSFEGKIYKIPSVHYYEMAFVNNFRGLPDVELDPSGALTMAYIDIDGVRHYALFLDRPEELREKLK